MGRKVFGWVGKIENRGYEYFWILKVVFSKVLDRLLR